MQTNLLLFCSHHQQPLVPDALSSFLHQLGGSVLKGSKNNPQPVLGGFPGTLLCFAPGPTAPALFPGVSMQAAALQTSLLGFKPNPGLL